MRNTIVACGLILLATTAAANPARPEATIVVAKFYNWYLAEHGNVDWYPQHRNVDWQRAMHQHSEKYFQARAFLHPTLFEGLDDTYSLSMGVAAGPPFYVNTTARDDPKKMSSFDPYAGASSPATSYQIGSSWLGHASVWDNGPAELRQVTLVPVTFKFAHAQSEAGVTVVVRKNGSSYQIYDILYGSIPFYYAGPIRDLLHFLSKYNC